MALPILVLLTKSCNPIINTTEAMIVTMVTIEICMLPTEIGGASMMAGNALPEDPKISCAKFCKKMLTPMAVMRSEMRATLRFKSLRYAMRSIKSARTTQATMEPSTATTRGIPPITRTT